MLDTDQRKIVLRAMRTEAIILISQSSEDAIKKTVESDVLQSHLIDQIWENAVRRLRQDGHGDLCERSKLVNFDHSQIHHTTRTFFGNMRETLQNCRDARPIETNTARLEFWDAAWLEQKGKMKRMKMLDAESLPKRVRIAQDAAATSSGRTDVTGSGTIARTLFNAQCAHLIGIPHEALIEGRSIGSGAFGEVKEYTIKGVSFFPEHITYCGKLYKGVGSSKFESFQTEQGMQVLHPSIVRCIAFTKEAPWITIFPYFNGGSLGDLLLKVPFRYSDFTKAMFRLDQGWRRAPPADAQINSVTLARIKAVVLNLPNIMHALVDGLCAAHMAGIIHTDMHPFNVVLDFTSDQRARVGIIDWGLLLRAPKKRISLNYVYDAAKNPNKVADSLSYAEREKRKRGWMAPELYDPSLEDAYTQASDVYALGYILEILYEFSKTATQLWMQDSSIDRIVLETIHHKVRNWMYLSNREERKSLLQVSEFFRSLTSDPTRAQRPLVELTISFAH